MKIMNKHPQRVFRAAFPWLKFIAGYGLAFVWSNGVWADTNDAEKTEKEMFWEAAKIGRSGTESNVTVLTDLPVAVERDDLEEADEDTREARIGRELMTLSSPVLKQRDDGAYDFVQLGAGERVQQVSFRTSYLRKTRGWLQPNRRDVKPPMLDFGVGVSETEEGMQVNKFEVGTGSKLLWFMFEEGEEDHVDGSVEIRLPF